MSREEETQKFKDDLIIRVIKELGSDAYTYSYIRDCGNMKYGKVLTGGDVKRFLKEHKGGN